MTSKGEDREALIEEAKRTLAQYDRVWAKTSNNPLPSRGVSASLRALIAAFEQALGEATSTPTDDEREALARLMCEKEDSGTYSEDEGTCSWHFELADAILAAGFRRPVQGEPTDAQVRAVWDALGPGITVAFEYEELRTALRATFQTGGQ